MNKKENEVLLFDEDFGQLEIVEINSDIDDLGIEVYARELAPAAAC